jgi:hypothetical protein
LHIKVASGGDPSRNEPKVHGKTKPRLGPICDALEQGVDSKSAALKVRTIAGKTELGLTDSGSSWNKAT